jgi:hypothetical protein
MTPRTCSVLSAKKATGETPSSPHTTLFNLIKWTELSSLWGENKEKLLCGWKMPYFKRFFVQKPWFFARRNKGETGFLGSVLGNPGFSGV